MTFNEKAITIFAHHYIGAIATIDDDGAPRSTPIHMVRDGEYVYWLSNPDKIHSQNIARDDRTFLTLFSPNVQQGLQGVYITGRTERLDNSQQPLVYELLSARVGAHNMPPNMGESAAYRIAVGQLNTEKSTGNCWYFYSTKND